jgi:hypothetical protein
MVLGVLFYFCFDTIVETARAPNAAVRVRYPLRITVQPDNPWFPFAWWLNLLLTIFGAGCLAAVILVGGAFVCRGPRECIFNKISGTVQKRGKLLCQIEDIKEIRISIESFDKWWLWWVPREEDRKHYYSVQLHAKLSFVINDLRIAEALASRLREWMANDRNPTGPANPSNPRGLSCT